MVGDKDASLSVGIYLERYASIQWTRKNKTLMLCALHACFFKRQLKPNKLPTQSVLLLSPFLLLSRSTRLKSFLEL